jgi:hypothetical protein
MSLTKNLKRLGRARQIEKQEERDYLDSFKPSTLTPYNRLLIAIDAAERHVAFIRDYGNTNDLPEAVARLQKLKDERDAMDREAAERSNLIRETCQQIRDRMTQADYDAWWEAAPDDGFLDAAKRKLADLELAEVMDDPSASAIQQSDAIDRWMKVCWDSIPEVEF